MSATSRNILGCKRHSNPRSSEPKELLDLNNDNTIELSIIQVGIHCVARKKDGPRVRRVTINSHYEY